MDKLQIGKLLEEMKHITELLILLDVRDIHEYALFFIKARRVHEIQAMVKGDPLYKPAEIKPFEGTSHKVPPPPTAAGKCRLTLVPTSEDE